MTTTPALELQQLEPVAQARMAEEARAYLVGARAGQGQLFTAQELRTGTPQLEAAGQGSLFEVIR